MKKNLPISISSFEKMVLNNYLYIDKTEYAYNLFNRQSGYSYVFLARPRRFGKSLFLDTLKQLFLAKKDLFKDLWIYNSDWEWQEHPIIHIDFSNFNKRSPEELEDHILNFLILYGQSYNIDLSGYANIQGKFSLLIKGLAKINPVVILVDEYDKPLLDNINDIKKASEMRDLLKSFYEVIKGHDVYIRALFMTGVTKFSQVSVFSGLNNIKDISMDDPYSSLLGYTQKEIELFGDYIESSSRILNISKDDLLRNIKTWYNGYRFTDREVSVYNPYSIINFFSTNKFENYWFSTGTPTFLIKLLKQQYPDFGDVAKYTISPNTFNTFDLENLPIVPILYQAGYLTITDYDTQTRRYRLGYPNFEVDESFNKIIAEALVNVNLQKVETFTDKIYNHLQNNDLDIFFRTIQNFISTIPSELLIDKEAYYNTIFHCILSLVSNQVYSQTSHFRRRSDTVITINGRTYIFELKLNKTAKEALDQIFEKKYYEPYLNKPEKIYLVGVNFDTDSIVNIDYVSQELS